MMLRSGDQERGGGAAVPAITPKVVAWLVGGGAALYLVLAAIGLLLTRPLAHSDLMKEDLTISRWFFDERTPTLNTVTHFGSSMSDTAVAIAVTLIAMMVLRWWLGRWREPLTVLAAIMGELFVFLLVTNSVGRARPTVPHLDAAPPTSSFPSGHTAAAVALYGCMAIIVVRRMSDRTIARILAVLFWCVPIAVGLSRVYRGMHFTTDVIFGALGGGTWLSLVILFLLGRSVPGAATADAGSASSRS
jgi:membrane-associated phospholipid phosphatase